MERLSASASELKSKLSKRSDGQWRAEVLKELAKSALYFRGKDDPLTDAEVEVFLGGLAGQELSRIRAAFQRAYQACAFMPKLADIYRLMPELELKPQLPDVFGPVVKSWSETVGRMTLYYEENEEGNRRVVRIEK